MYTTYCQPLTCQSLDVQTPLGLFISHLDYSAPNL
jgi:hypothetical protein